MLKFVLGVLVGYGVASYPAQSQTLPCRTHVECYQMRELLRERLYDRGESSMLFELRRYERGDVDRRQVEEIMRDWDQQRVSPLGRDGCSRTSPLCQD